MTGLKYPMATFAILLASGLGAAQSPPSNVPQAAVPVSPAPMLPALEAGWDPNCRPMMAVETGRGFLESDRAFPNFIGPISNPVLSKDPRALTEARLLFIQNKIDPTHPLGGGDFQVYAMQLRFALTERLSFIADKDGYAVIHPGNGGKREGWLNIAAGLKYAFIRDVENQFLVTGGLMFEPQTGESAVFQGHGDGLFTAFGTVGKEFAQTYHFLGTMGYEFPSDRSENSSFFYTSLHLDKQLMGWLYPLVELNWFHWTSGGDRGLPPALGEGDGLLNLGTSGVAGNDLVTLAVGMKAMLNQSTELGAAWEFPISNRHDLLNNRLLVELIHRY